MEAKYWVIILAIFIFFLALVITAIIMYYRITNKLKNGLVARIHMTDSTVRQYRYDIIPTNDMFTIEETDKDGKDISFTYAIKQECIEQGKWGRFIDYDYHVMNPISPRERNNTPFIHELKELFKLVAGLLDTDLYVKLMRSAKFEEKVMMMLTILMIVCCLGMAFSGTLLVKSFMTKSSDTNKVCTLELDAQTWNTIYIASHVPAPKVNNTVPTT